MSDQKPRAFHTEEHYRVFMDAEKAKLDCHVAVAAWYYGVPLSAVTREQRLVAKEANYFYLYGQR